MKQVLDSEKNLNQQLDRAIKNLEREKHQSKLEIDGLQEQIAQIRKEFSLQDSFRDSLNAQDEDERFLTIVQNTRLDGGEIIKTNIIHKDRFDSKPVTYESATAANYDSEFLRQKNRKLEEEFESMLPGTTSNR